MRYSSSNYHLCKSDTQVLIRSITYFLPYTLLSQCSRARRIPLLSPARSRARHVCRAREEGESERTTQLRKYRRRRSPPLPRLLGNAATRESAFSTTQFPSRRSPSPLRTLSLQICTPDHRYYTRCRHFSPRWAQEQAELISF